MSTILPDLNVIHKHLKNKLANLINIQHIEYSIEYFNDDELVDCNYIFIRLNKYIDIKITNYNDKYIGNYYIYNPKFDNNDNLHFVDYPGFNKSFCYSPINKSNNIVDYIISNIINDINYLLKLIILDMELENELLSISEEYDDIIDFEYYTYYDHLQLNISSRYRFTIANFIFDYNIINDNQILINCRINDEYFTYNCNNINQCIDIIIEFIKSI